ncbi:MAG: helix-turn-helix transcriptional regulator, partial [Deltaproteobacteria bacterium]|nr:helix-turn-helix transcriptional regulator [Deltaproteobacteria bacterium]
MGDHLRKRRLDLRLLQRQVAPRLGAAEATITSWETNQATPSVRFLPAIIRFLGYDPRPLSATSSATASLGTTVPDRLRA